MKLKSPYFYKKIKLLPSLNLPPFLEYNNNIKLNQGVFLSIFKV